MRGSVIFILALSCLSLIIFLSCFHFLSLSYSLSLSFSRIHSFSYIQASEIQRFSLLFFLSISDSLSLSLYIFLFHSMSPLSSLMSGHRWELIKQKDQMCKHHQNSEWLGSLGKQDLMS